MTEARERGSWKPHLGVIWTRILSYCRWLGHQRARAILVFGLMGGLGSTAFGLLFGPPLPEVHDEFAYLLAADTFAEGRLTNPTHPFWEHFESFHIIHEPTYQAKYPPGQGLLLALGKTLTGDPSYGVWIGAGLLSASLAWSLLVWLPPAWAVLLAAFATAQIGWFSYWAQSFWGGAVAGIGGALVIGAYGTIRKEARVWSGVVLGGGLVILALSRPFEGAILGVLVGSTLLLRGIRRTRARQGGILIRGLVPATLVVALGLTALGSYHQAVTGSALPMPYQVYEEQYAAAPTLIFQTPGEPPTYRHAAMERYWMEWGKARHEAHRSLSTLAPATAHKLLIILGFFLGPAVAAFIIAGIAPTARPEPVLTAGLLAVLAAALMTKGAYPHYLAPATAIFFIITGNGLRYLHRRARRKGTSWNLATLIMTASLLMVFASLVNLVGAQGDGFGPQRQSVKDHVLANATGPHLVLVAYAPDHDYQQEWVYNRAVIDEAEVVWARSMGPERDALLRTYFGDRTAWRLTVGREGLELVYLDAGRD